MVKNYSLPIYNSDMGMVKHAHSYFKEVDMSIKQKIRDAIKLPKEFITLFIVKTTHHKGKYSSFKTFIFILVICYLIVQPLNIIRAALASSFAGYMLNNFTNNIMNTVIEVG